jgi:hypothetical protein
VDWYIFIVIVYVAGAIPTGVLGPIVSEEGAHFALCLGTFVVSVARIVVILEKIPEYVYRFA